MPSLTKTFWDKVRVRHVWIFLTEKCNLSCDYCFFGDRQGVRTISPAQIKALLERLPRGPRYDIVFSGGEPLLEWAMLKDMIIFARRLHPNADLTLQTNALLLDRSKVRFLKAQGLVVEPGIDGLFASNFRHRKGLGEKRFRRLLKNIELLVSEKVPMNPTMTVHPSEVDQMRENFSSLVKIGLRPIDVHPAFLAPWTCPQATRFERAYREIVLREAALKKYLICKSYSSFIKPSFDLVVQPDGNVLPNWTYLTFSRKLREQFYVMELGKDGPRLRTGVIAGYLKSLARFFGQPRTYRDLSNFNAARALYVLKDRAVTRSFLVYKDLCRRVQAIDQPYLRNADRLDSPLETGKSLRLRPSQ